MEGQLLKRRSKYDFKINRLTDLREREVTSEGKYGLILPIKYIIDIVVI